jgi:NAD(P)-dependent dehydrogenase (short-subunit alcohol dehydrogenase family)
MAMRLQGRNALVTGGAVGIGRAIAARLLSEGSRVALTSRRMERAREAASTLDPSRARAAGFALDAADRGSIRAAVRAAAAWLGPIDIVVNNAGISGRTPVDEDSEELWRQILAVNLDGPHFVIRDALPLMRPGAGRIINISSVLGKYGIAARGAYCASKHGLIGLTRALAPELIGRGITVNAICPDWVDTEMAAKSVAQAAAMLGTTPAEYRRQAAQGMPGGRFLEPAEVAALVAYLASDEAAGMTGQALNLCGGATTA